MDTTNRITPEFYPPMKIVLIFLIFAAIVWAETFTGYRMIQYDSQSSLLGSRSVAVTAPMKSFGANTEAGPVAWFSRYMLVVSLEYFLESNFCQAVMNRTDVLGVIVSIPKVINASDREKYIAMQGALYQSTTKAVFFTHQEIHDMSETNFEYTQVMTFDRDATIVAPLNLYNLQGTLTGSTKKSIALVANYDSISAFPELGPGYEGASSVVAILELSRLFSQLYHSAKGEYNIIFLLTSGGRLNYEGTKHWLRKLPTNLFENLEFTLCLEGLLGREMFLQISEKSTNKDVIRFYSDLQKTASELKVPLTMKLKKINTAASEIPFEHEVLSYQNKLNAATLTSWHNPPSQWNRASPVEEKPDLKVLERNIRLVAETLAKFIYGQSIEVFRGSLDIHGGSIASWMKSFASVSRFVPLLKQDSPLVVSLKKTLSASTDVIEQEFESKTNIKFYNNQRVKMETSKVKSIWFDLLVLLPVLGYFVALHVAIVGPTDAIANLKSLF